MNEHGDPLIGQVIQDRYRIGKVLGAGGMGKVYLAQQLDLERPVAFKVLLAQFAHDNEFLLRFRREARQLASLKDHSRVVDIYGSGELPDGGLFIVMEYVDGPTLQEVIKTTGPLPLSRAAALGIQLAEGLREAHRVGIVHRDIKPANIKVWDAAEGEGIKILDFGIAQALNPETWMQITHTNVIIGSPKYMAPETIREGEYSERSDLYAWGAVLYEMLHGQPPFNAKTAEAVKYQHVNEPPKPLRELRPDVPVALERIVMHALEKDPAQRPANMQAVITALRTVDLTTTHEPTASTIILNDQLAADLPLDSPPEKKRRRLQVNLKWLGLALSVTLAGVLAFAMLPSTRETGSTPKPESLPASVEPISPVKPTPRISPANDRTDETRKKISDHLGMANFYMENDQTNEAKAEFESVLAIDANNQQARAGVNRINGATVVDEATMKQVKDHLGMAKFYLDEGQTEDALAQLEAAKVIAPNDPDVTAMLKRVQVEKKKRR